MGTEQERRLSHLACCMTNRPRPKLSGQERVFRVAARSSRGEMLCTRHPDVFEANQLKSIRASRSPAQSAYPRQAYWQVKGRPDLKVTDLGATRLRRELRCSGSNRRDQLSAFLLSRKRPRFGVRISDKHRDLRSDRLTEARRRKAWGFQDKGTGSRFSAGPPRTLASRVSFSLRRARPGGRLCRASPHKGRRRSVAQRDRARDSA